MSSADTAAYRSPATAFLPISPTAAATEPTPLGQRLCIRQRLAANVYLADCIADASPAPTQRVIKIGRLRRPWEASDKDSSPGAWQELCVARQLCAHAHVVRTVETHVYNGVAVVVLEHCAGGDLFAYLSRAPGGRLAPREALRKLREIASGLDFLHRSNVAHRDVSLENVLLTCDGVCKLCDFGLSTRADALSREVVGKTQYAAPEVVRGAWYDPVRADLWSLGVVLFMLLTGSPLVPFASPSCAEFRALEAVGVRGVLHAWGLQDQFSASTIDLLEKLLQIHPQNRLARAREVLYHPAVLSEALSEVSTAL